MLDYASLTGDNRLHTYLSCNFREHTENIFVLPKSKNLSSGLDSPYHPNQAQWLITLSTNPSTHVGTVKKISISCFARRKENHSFKSSKKQNLFSKKLGKDESDATVTTAKNIEEKMSAFLPRTPPKWYMELSENQENLLTASAWLCLLCALIFLSKVAFFNTACVPSSSMAPTLPPGDCVFVEILSSKVLGKPTRGKVVVFFPPSSALSGISRGQEIGEQIEPVQYVKRIVAIAGDTVQVKEGLVYVNQKPRIEEANMYNRNQSTRSNSKDESMLQAKYEIPAIVVPSGALFVLGDNRNRSFDSHVWGFLPESQVIGRCWFKWFPFSHVGFL